MGVSVEYLLGNYNDILKESLRGGDCYRRKDQK